MIHNNQNIKVIQQKMVDALRVVIAAAGALHYATYENLKPICNDLKQMDINQSTPSILDFKKDIEKIITLAEGLNTKMKIRFIGKNSQDKFENISYGIFQCISMLCVKPENEIYHEAIRLSETELTYKSLPEQINFLESVLDRSRKSNHDAFIMIRERKEVLEALNVQPLLISSTGEVKILDIAPEREEIDDII